MNNPRPKYKFSMLSVVAIFVLVYLTELGLGAGIFFNFVLPKIENYYVSKATSAVSGNIISQQTAVYSLVKENKLDEASKSAQVMLESSKNDAEKGLSLQVIGEVKSVASGSYEAGKSDFVNALKLNPNLSGALIGLAGAELAQKHYQNAIIDSQKAIGLAPKRTDYYFTLGLAYFDSGNKDTGIANIQKAVNGNPTNETYKKTLDGIKNGTIQPASSQNQPKNAPSSVPAASNSGPGYTQADIKIWQDQLSYIDQDLKNIPNFLGNSAYDQGKLNQMLNLLNQRKSIASNLYNKMVNNQTLASSDQQSIVTYEQIVTQYDSIAKQVFPKP